MTNIRLQMVCKKEAQNGRRSGLISIVLAILGFGWCFLLPLSQAEQFSESPPALEISEKQAILRAILSSIDQLEQEVRVKQEELRSPRAEGRREELIQEIKEIGNKLGELRRNFNEIASGVDPAIFSASEEVEINWTKELKELLRPVINELRRLSARPREIDQLRTKIARYREQRLQVEKGLNNIQELAKQTSDPELVSHLLQLQEEWQDVSLRYRLEFPECPFPVLESGDASVERRTGTRRGTDYIQWCPLVSPLSQLLHSLGKP